MLTSMQDDKNFWVYGKYLSERDQEYQRDLRLGIKYKNFTYPELIDVRTFVGSKSELVKKLEEKANESINKNGEKQIIRYSIVPDWIVEMKGNQDNELHKQIKSHAEEGYENAKYYLQRINYALKRSENLNSD